MPSLPPLGPVLLALAAALPAPASAQSVILGPCREGHRWVASAEGGTPWAGYGRCETQEVMVVITCGAGWPELRIAHVAEAAPGAPPAQTLSVDGAGVEIRTPTTHRDATGLAYTRVPLTEAAVRALSGGGRAVLEIGATRLEMHLGASGDALGVVSRNC